MNESPSHGGNQDMDPAFTTNRNKDTQLTEVLQSIEAQQSELKQLRTELKETIKAEALNTARQLEAFHQLYSLVGNVPDSLHGWPISPDFALKLVRQIREEDYDLIIEFGSGISTYLELKSLETWIRPSSPDKLPKLVVFEHLEDYLEQTRKIVANCPLKHRIDLSLRPLEPWEDESGQYTFYSGTEIIGTIIRKLHARQCLDRKNHNNSSLKVLVVIDGPPGTTCPWARYPAVPIVLNSCSGLAVTIDFLLDDVLRFDEREMANAWEKMLQSLAISYTREDLRFEKGGLLIHMSSLTDAGASPPNPIEEESLREDTLEIITRKLDTLELECDRRYAAIRLSQEQTLRIANLEQQLGEAQHTIAELRSQLDSTINSLSHVEQSLEQAQEQQQFQGEPRTAGSDSPDQLKQTAEVAGKLEDENLLLQLQLQQVQEELEHYVLLSQGLSPEACDSMDEGKHVSRNPPENRKSDKEVINANRAFLQTSS